VTPDFISDHISRLAQIRSAVEALSPILPPSKRCHLGIAPHLYEGVTELHSIPGVPIGFQALAQLNLTSSIPSVHWEYKLWLICEQEQMHLILSFISPIKGRGLTSL